MSRKSISFKAPAPPRRTAKEEAAASLATMPAQPEAWVSSEADANGKVGTSVEATPDPRPTQPAPGEPALRIARIAPLWLGWYHYVGAMTDFLRRC